MTTQTTKERYGLGLDQYSHALLKTLAEKERRTHLAQFTQMMMFYIEHHEHLLKKETEKS